MKKILLTAAVALVCLGAKAQDVTTVTSSPLTFGLDCDDISTLTFDAPTSNLVQAKHFNSPAMYDVSTWSLTSTSLGHASFYVSSNRFYDVTAAVSNITFTPNGHENLAPDVNSVMPATVIGYAADYTPPPVGFGDQHTTGVLAAPDHVTTPPTPFLGFGTPAQILSGAGFGKGSYFQLHMHAMPGWLYTGGLYTGTFTVTATQI